MIELVIAEILSFMSKTSTHLGVCNYSGLKLERVRKKHAHTAITLWQYQYCVSDQVCLRLEHLWPAMEFCRKVHYRFRTCCFPLDLSLIQGSVHLHGRTIHFPCLVLTLLLPSLFAVQWLILAASRYTMLVGSPPFETKSLKETFTRIRRNEYSLPHQVCTCACWRTWLRWCEVWWWKNN